MHCTDYELFSQRYAASQTNTCVNRRNVIPFTQSYLKPTLSNAHNVLIVTYERDENIMSNVFTGLIRCWQ